MTLVADARPEAAVADEALAHAQEALSDAYGHLSQVVQAMPGALIVLQGEGTIVEINPAASELLDASAEDLLWHSVEPYLGEEHPSVGQLFAQLRRDGSAQGVRFESRWRSRGGRSIQVLFSARLLVGSPTRLVCVLLDITEQKRLEVELHHAQKLEAVGQLATGIVHEISTPIQFIGDRVHAIESALARIIGPSTAPSEDPVVRLLHEMAEGIADAKEGLERIDDIIRATRSFSHPKRRKKQATDLRSVIESTLVVTRNQHKYVANVFVTKDDIPPAFCCAGDVRQVVLALIVNATHAVAKARSKGRLGTIRVGLECDDSEVTLSVADDGVGIHPRFHERIFEPFFSTKDESSGTGQGLSIAKHLVEENGGRIWVRSQPDFGATFYVSLPRAQS